MPELPEVETVRQALHQNLQGRRLTGLRVRFRGVFSDPLPRVRRALLGARLTAVHRHGKYLILSYAREASDGVAGYAASGRRIAAPAPAEVRDQESVDGASVHLMLHLRMTGQIFVSDGYRPDKHVHATFDYDGLPVHYRGIRKFGRFTLVDDGRHPAAIAHVGPDILTVRFADWHARVADRRAPIKAVLLDQGVAAGLGNIYVDEALHRAGIHPATAAAALTRDQLRKLLRCAKGVLRLAIRHGGTTFLNFTNFNGRPGGFRRRLRVYGCAGSPCRRCGAVLERERIAGRSSHYCPRCQPLAG
jgi:formamidopyrimidine-DNA glycosylase